MATTFEKLCERLSLIEEMIQRAVATLTAHSALSMGERIEALRAAYHAYADAMVTWHCDLIDLEEQHGRKLDFDLNRPELEALERNCILQARPARIQ